MDSSEQDTGAVRGAHEKHVADWAASVRGQYERREDYNAAVCNELAARGIPPLANVVLRVGRWGNAASIARDVEAWYAQLASRLQAQEAQIPLAARSTANKLVEQLWRSALQDVDRRIARPLRETLEAAQSAGAELAQQHREVAAKLAEVSSRHDAEQAAASALRADMDRLKQEAVLAAERAASMLLQEQREHTATRTAADQAMLAALAQAKTAEDKLLKRWEEDVRTAKAEQNALQRQLEEATRATQAAQQSTKYERDRLEKLGAVNEKLREDLAHAQGLLEGLRGQLAATVDHHAAMQSTLRDELAVCRAQLDRMQRDALAADDAKIAGSKEASKRVRSTKRAEPKPARPPKNG